MSRLRANGGNTLRTYDITPKEISTLEPDVVNVNTLMVGGFNRALDEYLPNG